jgi:hypothetical protein
MATHSVSVAPDRVIEWSDSDDMPILESYCADPFCSPSTLCRRCLLENGIACQVCRDVDAVTFDDDGTPSGLAICGRCKAECDAEDAVEKGGA